MENKAFLPILFFLCFSMSLFSQEEKPLVKEIKGNITYVNSPLFNVAIAVLGTTNATKTNAQGDYSIKATIGDMIQYSHIGFKTVTIMIEDVTSILNFEMRILENKLDEVMITASGKRGKTLELAKKREKKISTSRGGIDLRKVGYAVSYIDGKDINPGYQTLSQALVGKAAGVFMDENNRLRVRPRTSMNLPMYPIWDIDGQIFNIEPPIDLSLIESIYIIKTLAGTMRYGPMGAGGVIVVNTKYGSFDDIEAKRKKIEEEHTNKNYYLDDALSVNTETLSANIYTTALQKFNNKQKAFAYYSETLKGQIKEYSKHISIAQKFISYYNDSNMASYILKGLTVKHKNNPEILKAVAYHFQALGLKKEAINVYKNIYTLRAKYAQSYRDLANAYIENKQYKKAWRMYMSYLIQGNDVSGEGIGQILYNEMEFLFYNRKSQASIRKTFTPKSRNVSDFSNDVRFVFEWNASEAEFDLEFVNADKRVYDFKHSLVANQNLITDEKKKGYSSKEFFIDEIGKGEWLINITYKGNKKPEPTYFKITQYFNWGKSNQRQVIKVYKFQNERGKIQLLKLNKRVLVASN